MIICSSLVCGGVCLRNIYSLATLTSSSVVLHLSPVWEFQRPSPIGLQIQQKQGIFVLTAVRSLVLIQNSRGFESVAFHWAEIHLIIPLAFCSSKFGRSQKMLLYNCICWMSLLIWKTGHEGKMPLEIKF